MAKYTTDEIGKPGKPPKVRPFPWRLWLFALVMTAAAGAGGYFTWHYREQAKAAVSSESTCLVTRSKLTAERGDIDKKLADCSATLAKQTADMKATLDTSSKSAKTLEQQNAELMKNLSASKEELEQLRTLRAETEKRIAAIEDIQKQFAKMIDTGALKVTARRGALSLSLPAEVLFPSGVAELSKDGELKVLEVGLTLKKFPDRRFLVVGHSDNQPLKSSTFKDNWDLSAARALTVTRFLVQAGMSPKNILPAGAGEHDPLLDKATGKDLARNRRIEILLLPAINELPPLPASITEDKAADKK
jgi:chemotaxis protein MotB